MVEFFAKTWFLWWAIAVVIITRWFRVAAADDPSKERESERIGTPMESSAAFNREAEKKGLAR